MFIGKEKAREEVLKRFPNLGLYREGDFSYTELKQKNIIQKENEHFEKRLKKAQEILNERNKRKEKREERRKKIGEFINKGLSLNAVAKLFGVSRSRIHQIHNGYNTSDENLKKLKLIIKTRDNFQCQWGEKCKSEKGKGLIVDEKDLIVHHIDFNDENNDPKNLITLCKRCHSSFHSKFHIDSLKEKNLHLRQKGERIIKICKGCRKEMQLTPSQVKRRTFCSITCKNAFYNTPEIEEKRKQLQRECVKRYYQQNKEEINKKNKNIVRNGIRKIGIK